MSQPTDLFDPAARWAAPDPEPIIGDDLRGLLRQAFAIEEDGAAASPAAVVLKVALSAPDAGRCRGAAGRGRD